MTSVEQEAAALDQLVTALAYAQSARAVMDALLAFPDLASEAIAALFQIPQVRGMLRLSPGSGAHAAIQATYRVNLQRRSAYLVSAARRLSGAAQRGTLAQAQVAERRYLEQHLQADAVRVKAAEQVAAIARQQARAAKRDGSTWNGLLGWYAVMDANTSAECRRANGRNFNPTTRPRIGFPGSVHPHCRCRPGPPFATDERVETLRSPDGPAQAIPGRWRARQRILAG